MKKLFKVCFLLGAIMLLESPLFAQTQNVFRVNDQGQITLNNKTFRVKGGSWFGLEGRHEPSNDPNNPSGAPMEQYMGNVFWAESSRTYDQDINEMKQMGFNVIRLPLVHQTLDANDAQGKEPFLKNAQSVRIANARLALETIIKKLNTAGIYVLLDVHSCSNYVGWRAGRLDARPPYADANRDQYDYPREDCSCAASNNPSSVKKIQAYNTTTWLADLKTLAGLSSSLNVTNIIGIDIFNEPWDYSWSEWKSLIDQAYTAINSVNTNILIFAQGISSSNGNQDGTPNTKNDTPHGSAGNPNWGENLYEAADNPPSMPKDRLVYSPHAYGPSVCTQPMFADPSQPECATLQEDAFGNAKCQVVINPAVLEPSWEEHFGYLKAQGYAICIGEFGGNPDWPNKAEKRMQDRYAYLTDKTTDWQWQKAFVDYLLKKGITDTIYWSINPESGDTGGIYGHAYDPISNTAGWGTWQTPEQRKLDLLKKLWNAPSSTPPPTSSPSPANNKGDANGDGNVDIVDALLVAQYSVGISVNINMANADYDGDGSVTIVDALQIAQASVL